ncbi:peptide/nickel transport system substrate-binding protein [Labedella gwakjiensis]|uniref:ABC transporter substrate-binding protein n=1 Tax=Labedella gwakjiensis TaxID=390269 RepID=A0A2P8GW69_9MICO|nr:ABC transporter substrate-binding protein [Labedella gwakjiensis]PSL38208.1 peptide/nickel transport system substrate-binding protein [Labedella gwakjiensis]RUQ87250.1 ABC transporter substrate-binding protein [Labedella gwakjiensis]
MTTAPQRPKRRWRAALAGVAALTVALTGCAGGTPASTSGERPLVIARAMDLTTLDPQRGYCDTCQIIYTALYERLVTVDPADTSTVLPGLAESWEANEDNTQFTFALDADAVFSDGSPVESTDVKWSFERLVNLQGSASFLLAGMTGIETPDASTVVVTFEKPNSAFLAITAAPYLGIVNSEVAEENGASAAEDAASTDDAEGWFLENSAGSGPYTLADYSAGESVELTANDEYWGAAPAFTDVEMKEVTDSSSQLQQLQQGDVDVAMQISPDALAQLEGDEAVTTEVVDSYNYTYIALLPAAPGGEPLEDVRVREAIRMAVDYDGLVDTLVAGYGKLQGSPIPNGFEGSEEVALPSYDLDGAKALLAEAGYADGFTVSATYPKLVAYGVDLDLQMQAVQQDLAEIGVTLELNPVDFTQWIDTVSGDGTPVTAVYFAPDHTDSSQYVQYFGNIDQGGLINPWTGSVSQEQTDLLAQALAESGDERVATYQALAESMAADAFVLPMVNPQLILAYASDISGVAYSPCCNLEIGQLGLTG